MDLSDQLLQNVWKKDLGSVFGEKSNLALRISLWNRSKKWYGWWKTQGRWREAPSGWSSIEIAFHCFDLSPWSVGSRLICVSVVSCAGVCDQK